MADTISHATQGGLLLLAPFIHRIRKRTWLWLLAFTGAFFGALPDLLGAYGNFVLHDHWSLYASAHHGPIREILQYVPMYWLHLEVDSVMHGEHHRWWKMDERLWLEFVFWVINLMVITWYWRIWKRNRRDRYPPTSLNKEIQ